jgi:hypothetical protein
VTSSTNDNTTDALVREIRELRHDITELRLLVLYGLLKAEEEPRGRLNETLLALAKQALKAAAGQLAELDRESHVETTKRRPTKVAVKSRQEGRTPTADVNDEIAILKREMAKSLRDAAKEVDRDVKGDKP